MESSSARYENINISTRYTFQVEKSMKHTIFSWAETFLTRTYTMQEWNFNEKWRELEYFSFSEIKTTKKLNFQHPFPHLIQRLNICQILMHLK